MQFKTFSGIGLRLQSATDTLESVCLLGSYETYCVLIIILCDTTHTVQTTYLVKGLWSTALLKKPLSYQVWFVLAISMERLVDWSRNVNSSPIIILKTNGFLKHNKTRVFGADQKFLKWLWRLFEQYMFKLRVIMQVWLHLSVLSGWFKHCVSLFLSFLLMPLPRSLCSLPQGTQER